MDPDAAQRSATGVGLINLPIGMALVLALSRAGRLLSARDHSVALRVIGTLDLALVPGLLAGRLRWQWMAARAGLNLVIRRLLSAPRAPGKGHRSRGKCSCHGGGHHRRHANDQCFTPRPQRQRITRSPAHQRPRPPAARGVQPVPTRTTARPGGVPSPAAEDGVLVGQPGQQHGAFQVRHRPGISRTLGRPGVPDEAADPASSRSNLPL